MYVPPFVPQPIEIPGNVAQESYAARLGFIRRVVMLHFGTVLVVAGLALLPMGSAPSGTSALALLAVLIVLSAIRGMAKGRMTDQRLSSALLPLLLFVLAACLRSLTGDGWPTWAPGVGIACAITYSMFCGRDLSFIGMFTIAGMVSSAMVAIIGWRSHVGFLYTASALSLNALFLFYYVYDLAALLTRRRMGEEWGAVVDLYRDVLNGFTYPIRVFHHWRENRIWIPPKEWFR